MRFVQFFTRNPLRELVTSPPGQMPALDALRSCAILMVIFCHSSASYQHQKGAENLFAALPFVRGGWLGVDLFFILSGYLIGKQLWRELQKTGSVRVGRFILRRGLRIWPLYFAMLALLVSIGRSDDWALGRGWVDAVFLSNYVRGGVVPGGWSLCTEEHFYLLAPLLILLGTCRCESLASYRRPLLGCLVSLPALRALTYWGPADHAATFLNVFDRVYRPIHTHSDGLFMGLLLANFAAQGHGPNRRRGASACCLLAAAAVFAVSYVVHREVFLFSGAALFFGALTWFLLARPRLSAALFGFRPFYIVSRLSYGMYLNHLLVLPIVMAVEFKAISALSPGLHSAALGVVLAVTSLILAGVSYCLVEYPFLRLRARLLDPAAVGLTSSCGVSPTRQQGASPPPSLVGASD